MKTDNESTNITESAENSKTSAIDAQSNDTAQSRSQKTSTLHKHLDRRAFLNRTALAGLFAGGLMSVPGIFGRMGKVMAQEPGRCPSACELVPYTDGGVRADLAKQRRINAAIYERNMDIPLHPCNGDEQLYSGQNYFASYTKGLKRANGTAGDYYGEVDPVVYCTLLQALNSGIPADFEEVLLGFNNACNVVLLSDEASRLGVNALPANRQRRLESPQAGYNFDLEGKDYYQLINRPANQNTDPVPVAYPPAYTFASGQEAVEIIENYWQALTRDVAFVNYSSNALVQAAADDLDQFSSPPLARLYQGPTELNGRVTPAVYSRGVLRGDTVGPFISQFLLRDDIPYGAQTISSRIKSPSPRRILPRNVIPINDFMTTREEWLMIQKGQTPDRMISPNGVSYIKNGRDLASYVQNDAIYQPYLNAALLLMTPPPNPDQPPTFSGGLGVPLNPNNPYRANSSNPDRYCKQLNFVEFGPSQLLSLLGEVSVRAHKAIWYQKWQVHRRLRPEEFAARIHFNFNPPPDATSDPGPRYPVSSVINDSSVLPRINNIYGSYFLPQAFPEGSPLHPAYGSGHATLAGACVTILKAWFDSEQPYGNYAPFYQSNALGDTLNSLGTSISNTVADELNKLASNISIGRNIAGVHWRSDYTESVFLGEQVAIQLLRDYGFTYNEDFLGFSFRDFSGNMVTIGETRAV